MFIMFQTILWSGQGLLHEQVSVSFDKRAALCTLMQYENEPMYSILIHLYDILFYQMIIMLNLVLVRISLLQQFTVTSLKAWNKHCRYKES